MAIPVSCDSFLKIHSYDFDNRAKLILSDQDIKVVRMARNALAILTVGIFPMGCYFLWGKEQSLRVERHLRSMYEKPSKEILPDWTKPLDPFLMAKMKSVYKRAILEAKPSEKIEKASSDHVMGELYLGDCEAFTETIHHLCRESRSRWIDTSNPRQFKAVVTVCRLKEIAEDYRDLDKKALSTILETSFKTHKISWHYFGKTLGDDALDWCIFVHDCSFPESDLAKIEEWGWQSVNISDIRNQKRGQLLNFSVDQWFEPAFQELDLAVFQGQKTLVHCSAGVSRSPTLVAAYLIKRFEATSEQAINFLRSRRACVNSRFIDDLERYAAGLQKSKYSFVG